MIIMNPKVNIAIRHININKELIVLITYLSDESVNHEFKVYGNC